MNDKNKKLRTIPPNIGQVIVQGVIEILGFQEAEKVFTSFEDEERIDLSNIDRLTTNLPITFLSKLTHSMQQNYSPSVAHGLAARVGRACFNTCIRRYGADSEFTTLAFRLMPLEKKIDRAAVLFAELCPKLIGVEVRINNQQGAISISLDPCPACFGSRSHAPMCYFFVGIFQEALYWISGGKTFLITESACCAVSNRECTFTIFTQPVKD